MSFSPGQILEFATVEGFLLGAVTGTIGKKKLIVLDHRGVERRTSPKDVSYIFSQTPAARGPGAPDTLAALHDGAEARRADVDLSLAWEALRERDEKLTLAQVTATLFKDHGDIDRLATLRVLRRDVSYFKPRRDTFKPRTEAQVEKMRASLAARDREEEALERFLSLVHELLSLDATSRVKTLEAATRQESEVAERFATLREYATSGDDFERADLAEALLDRLEERVSLHGRGSLRAFHLMVDLGIWSTFENLWLHRYQVPTSFQPELLDEAAAIAQNHWEPEPWREDLTSLTCFTVDDAWSRDLDDAISCIPRIDGGWDIGIHIADPSAHVANDSPLDLAARARGTSIYLPTGTIPMLPEVLSEHTVSLLDGELRASMSTLVHVDRDLNVIDVAVKPSMIRVSHRLTYDEVDAVLANRSDSPVASVLRDLSFLASEFFHQRLNDGAVDFNIPDAKVSVSLDAREQPEVSIEILDQQSPARTLVAEIMILASAHMARFCYRNRIPVIYRSQDPPDGDLVDAEILSYPEGLPRTFAMLRRMKSGHITTYPEPHFALGLPMYVQATSPIRRYSDYICQRQVKAVMAGQAPALDAEAILRIASMVEHTSMEARRVERQTNRYWKLHYLATRRGEAIRATVVDWRDDRTATLFLQDVAMRHRCAFRQRHDLGASVEVIVDRADPRSDILRLREA